ncbi:unnamed protein product [Amoebophrya sp. A120]|nr:unnamed protein product [Amoebophrya sp. A120]|eukprot:GSA120T00013858001.1
MMGMRFTSGKRRFRGWRFSKRVGEWIEEEEEFEEVFLPAGAAPTSHGQHGATTPQHVEDGSRLSTGAGATTSHRVFDRSIKDPEENFYIFSDTTATSRGSGAYISLLLENKLAQKEEEQLNKSAILAQFSPMERAQDLMMSRQSAIDLSVLLPRKLHFLWVDAVPVEVAGDVVPGTAEDLFAGRSPQEAASDRRGSDVDVERPKSPTTFNPKKFHETVFYWVKKFRKTLLVMHLCKKPGSASADEFLDNLSFEVNLWTNNEPAVQEALIKFRGGRGRGPDDFLWKNNKYMKFSVRPIQTDLLESETRFLKKVRKDVELGGRVQQVAQAEPGSGPLSSSSSSVAEELQQSRSRGGELKNSAETIMHQSFIEKSSYVRNENEKHISFTSDLLGMEGFHPKMHQDLVRQYRKEAEKVVMRNVQIVRREDREHQGEQGNENLPKQGNKKTVYSSTSDASTTPLQQWLHAICPTLLSRGPEQTAFFSAIDVLKHAIVTFEQGVMLDLDVKLPDRYEQQFGESLLRSLYHFGYTLPQGPPPNYFYENNFLAVADVDLASSSAPDAGDGEAQAKGEGNFAADNARAASMSAKLLFYRFLEEMATLPLEKVDTKRSLGVFYKYETGLPVHPEALSRQLIYPPSGNL